jgi:hypothetical protein
MRRCVEQFTRHVGMWACASLQPLTCAAHVLHGADGPWQIAALLSGFQAAAQGYLARKRYRRAHGKEEAIRTIQKNAKVFIDLYQWSWWKLFRQVKPLLGIHRCVVPRDLFVFLCVLCAV